MEHNRWGAIHPLKPSAVYLTMRALSALASSIMFTTYALYYVKMLGLNPLQLLLVGTVLEVAIFLLEIPTGVVADLYSRRLSVIIGTFVLGAAFVVEGAIPWKPGFLTFFAAVLAAEVIRAFGETFVSGAREAWLADEVGPDQIGPIFLTAGKLDAAMGLLGIPVSVGLANLRLNLPYLAGGAIYLALATMLVLVMREEHFQPQPREEGKVLANMFGTFTEGVRSVRGKPVVIALLAVAVISGAASEGVGRLWEAHFLTTFHLDGILHLSAATWLGIMGVAGSLLGMLAAHLAERQMDLTRPATVTGALLVTAGLRTGLLLLFALAPGFGWALGAHLALPLAAAVYGPMHDTWLNQHVDSRVRATTLSMLSQADAIGQSGGGPLVGWVGSRFSLRAALALSALLLSPALGVYGAAFRRDRAAGEQ